MSERRQMPPLLRLPIAHAPLPEETGHRNDTEYDLARTRERLPAVMIPVRHDFSKLREISLNLS
ncbi:hypothetical protein [Sodalis glossinidius]|uniref:hypothetical protein n=1 Tax=Sodalis glossinidius TaxID=63612 RepID=UPI000317FC7F|nr:hypothetical protein [Sodalis glossinidius]